MSKIKIITDTGSDLLPEEAERAGICLLDFPLFIDGTEYRSGYDLPPARFFELQAQCKEFPQTTQITPQRYYDTFKSFEGEYDDAVCITLSARGSGSYNSACLARQMLIDEGASIRVTVVDSMGFAYMYAFAALEGARLADEGKPLETVLARIDDILSHYEIYAAVDTLEYLKKGGRINAATMFVGNLLDIHPVIGIKDGIIENLEKIRGNKRLYTKLSGFVCARADAETTDPVIIVHANAPEKAELLREQLEADLHPADIWIRDIGSIIGIHTGPGLVGAFYRAKRG